MILKFIKEKHNLKSEPDNTDFEIVEYSEDGPWMALKVRFPSCDSCSFEGIKVLVYYGVKPIDVMRWKKIDPHFREPSTVIANFEAPPPRARFPADSVGWDTACNYGRMKKLLEDLS